MLIVEEMVRRNIFERNHIERELMGVSKSVKDHSRILMYFLRRRREEKEMTQTELAMMANSSQKQISCYEKNLQVPSVNKLLDICKALELEIVIKRKNSKRILYRIKDFKEES